MKIAELTKAEDKIEITKQTKNVIQRVFTNRIIPHENHTLFEVDLKAKTIEKAIYDKNLCINWEDAVKGFISTNKQVTKNNDCIYISALNKRNVIKILKRDYQINL